MKQKITTLEQYEQAINALSDELLAINPILRELPLTQSQIEWITEQYIKPVLAERFDVSLSVLRNVYFNVKAEHKID